VFPGDVILTTNEGEVNDIKKRYPGEFQGDKGHFSGVLGYAYPDRQPGTVLLRRYFTGKKHVFTTRKLDNPRYKEEGLGAWVLEQAARGTSLQLGFLRKKDAAMEYGAEGTTGYFKRFGYQVSDLRFHLFREPAKP
jgi:hypothetical protein